MRQQTKEYSVMRMTRFCVSALVLVMTAAVGGQEKPTPAPASVAAAPVPAPGRGGQQLPLKIQLVLSRYQGDKKLSSVPYVLWVTSNDNLSPRTSLRMGVSIPIPGSGGTGYSYRDVGTNIDCAASGGFEGVYRVGLTVSDSSVYFADHDRSAPGQVPVNIASPPSLRTFTSNFSILLRDGQTAQYTSATDQVSGEQLKIDATLSVLK
jgi:hypothetical protein